MIYRIVRETNHLTDTVKFYIERKKTFLWSTSWTTELNLKGIYQRGPIGAPSYDGAKWKLDRIELKQGNMVDKEIVIKKYTHK